MSTRKRRAICEAVIAGALPLDEARRRRAEILERSRRGRILLRIERAERIVGGAPR
jgi:hypothetical protein